MAIFTTKITRSTFTLSPFTSEQMQEIGQVMLDAKIDRIRRSVDSTDSPAKPLGQQYARFKQNRGRAPVRDWFFRGATLGSLKVKAASEARVTIGATTSQADQVLTVQRRMNEMWSDSPKDVEALHAIIRYQLQHTQFIRRVTKKAA